MAAYEDNTPVDKEAEERQRTISKEYTSKLITEATVLPDPFSLKTGWLAELKGTGLQKWPSVYFVNIERFLTKFNMSSELLHRLECEYKEGKAYRYFSCDWVKEVFYHHISEQSKICFLKTRVTPSQSINNPAYHVCAAIQKDSERPGGDIISAYCSCTAGLLGCCNHVTGMLFRIEAAVRCGATNPSSTSVLSKWNVPVGNKTKIIHKPISEFNFHRSSYKNASKSKEKIEKANTAYRTFKFTSEANAKLLGDKQKMRQIIHDKLKNIVADSCFNDDW